LKNKLVSEAKVGDSDKVIVGEKVYVVGNPEGAGIAVTSGAISVESEYITMMSTDGKRSVDYRVIRTDAAINGGNSGGALYNAKGELIGIVNAKSVGDDMDNMGYALPISSVKHVCKNIFDNGGLVKRAMLGVMVSMESCKVEFDENGHLRKTETFVVAEEATSMTAAAYGKLKTGDVFRYIIINGGEKIYLTRQYQLNDVLMQVRKGDVVTLGVEREMVGETEVEITYNKETYFVAYA
jgi:serine protease Do